MEIDGGPVYEKVNRDNIMQNQLLDYINRYVINTTVSGNRKNAKEIETYLNRCLSLIRSNEEYLKKVLCETVTNGKKPFKIKNVRFQSDGSINTIQLYICNELVETANSTYSFISIHEDSNHDIFIDKDSKYPDFFEYFYELFVQVFLFFKENRDDVQAITDLRNDGLVLAEESGRHYGLGVIFSVKPEIYDEFGKIDEEAKIDTKIIFQSKQESELAGRQYKKEHGFRSLVDSINENDRFKNNIMIHLTQNNIYSNVPPYSYIFNQNKLSDMKVKRK